MEISFTTLSPNGQVVIPAEIRKQAGLTTATKFIVFNEGENILLKTVREDPLKEDIALIESVIRSEKQIREGKFTRVKASMSVKEMDELLLK